MKPGLERAVPMGILGFLAGIALVVILRALQDVDPVWDPEIALIMAAFTTSAAFVWGAGAFNPQLNQHPHAPEVDEETGMAIVPAEAHDEHEEDEEVVEGKPLTILGYSIWQISFISILVIVALLGFATLPTGLYLRTSGDPSASVADVGPDITVTLPFGGQELELTQMMTFAGFTIFTLLSLAVVGGIIGLVFLALSKGVTQANATEATEFGSLQPERNGDLLRMIVTNIIFLIVIAVLYVVFYYVLIGLVLPNPDWLRVILSIVNAIIFALLIFYPTPLLRVVGKFARRVADILRGVPDAVR